MKNILLVKSSIQGDQAQSNKLALAIVDRIKEQNEVKVVTRDLVREPPPHLDLATFTTLSTPPDKWTKEDKERAKHSEKIISELEAADTIVIAIPMYQFSIPSTLKAWLDSASRAGRTFSYSAAGPQGLLKNKKVYLAISSGGIYKGPMASMDFTETYMRAVLSFFGLTDVTAYRVEGTKMPDFAATALSKAIEQIAV